MHDDASTQANRKPAKRQPRLLLFMMLSLARKGLDGRDLAPPRSCGLRHYPGATVFDSDRAAAYRLRIPFHPQAGPST
jgi:hypothetical protein